jgi:hypothetical protein
MHWTKKRVEGIFFSVFLYVQYKSYNLLRKYNKLKEEETTSASKNKKK